MGQATDQIARTRVFSVWADKLIWPMIVLLLGGMTTSYLTTRDRLTTLEGVVDDIGEISKIRDRLSTLQVQIAEIQNRPPAWVLTRLSDTEERLRALERGR